MSAVRRSFALIVIFAALLAMAGCQDSQTDTGSFAWKPLYGDFTQDTTPVIAQVGDYEITQRMLELYIDELPPGLKSDFEGPDGERLAVKRMIDQTLMVHGAVAIKLYNDQDVARQLISQRRNTLDYAMRQYGVLRGNEPDEDELRKYFSENKDNYRQSGLVLTRHVECMSKADADLAYNRIMGGEYADSFVRVVAEMSVNDDTKAEEGSTGWFNKGGFVPYIRASEQYADLAYDYDIGVHPPVKVADRWHVIEVLQREYERPQTFTEARDQLLQDMLPAWQDGLIKDYLAESRVTHPVVLKGRYAPGQGASEDELFRRAVAVVDPQKRLDLLSMLINDYPSGTKADDALFMSANIALETWQDVRIAERYLNQLLNDYPDSDLIEDAKFLRDNLHNGKLRNPQSIEDLRQN